MMVTWPGVSSTSMGKTPSIIPGMPSGRHPLLEVQSVRCLAGKGLEGDRFVTQPKSGKGQVTFFDAAVHEDLCEKLAVTNRGPGVFRRNIVVRGLNLNGLIGVEFEIQGVRFKGTQSCEPCYWMEEAFAPGAEALLSGRGGLRAEIITDGEIAVGP
jgi:MOSC domain-containing protein YiiM